MPTSLPYLSSNKNLPTLLQKIQSAKVPEKFNRDFLQATIGLKGSNDRAYIPFLRALGFIDQAGTPTSQYRKLKAAASAKTAIGDAMRVAYAPLFEADENANALAAEQLKALVAQVAGTDDLMTSRIVNTFSSMVKLGDFSQIAEIQKAKELEGEEEASPPDADKSMQLRGKGLRPEFHYNIQVHLPSNGTEEVYLSIFNALRKAFQ